jgi:hypothetical protein
LNIDGRVLDPVCRIESDRNRVSDECLEWHFRHTVLQWFRASAGPQPWQRDIDPDGDDLGQIRQGPYASLVMELELANRLLPYQEAQPA